MNDTGTGSSEVIDAADETWSSRVEKQMKQRHRFAIGRLGESQILVLRSLCLAYNYGWQLDREDSESARALLMPISGPIPS